MLKRFATSRWIHVLLLMALLATALVFSFSPARWREQIRNFTFDNYNIMKPRPASDDVVIVDIDEASLKKIGQMPWPRNIMAHIVDSLKSMGAKVIAFDIVFAEPDRSSPSNLTQMFESQKGAEDIIERLKAMPDNDMVFGDAVTQAGNVVTGFSFTNEPTDASPMQKGIFRGRDVEKFIPRLQGATVNQKSINKNAAGNGSFFVSTDTDGIIRRVPMLVGLARHNSDIVSVYPSLALETIRVLDGQRGGRVLVADSEYAKLDPHRFGITGIQIGSGGRVIPTDARGEFLVWFSQSNPDWYIPAWRVLAGEVAPEEIKDKIILIGTSAVGLKDIRSTPLETFRPGVEVHRNIIDQILHGQYLKRSIEAEGMEAFAIFAIGLFLIMAAPFLGALTQTMIVAVAIGGSFYGGLYLFAHYGLLVDVTYLSLSVFAIFILSLLLTYMRTEAERRAVRQAFGLYISPDFMKELTKDPDKLRLGGETRELTVMFSDIRNFTAISEGLSPQELISLMNDFLTPMTNLVMETRGTIDKYIGDAMMAFWNAPLDDADHARHACTAALSMQNALAPINEGIRARGGKTLLKAGIGINTGACAVGNMGSKQRFAYSTLGDAVNLASRLEGQTKVYGVPIIIGEATRAQAPEFAALELDLIRVKGKTQPVRIFALMGDAGMARSEEFSAFQRYHNAMLAAYRAGDFEKTMRYLMESVARDIWNMEDCYAFYLDRVRALLKERPQNWDGVYAAKGK